MLDGPATSSVADIKRLNQADIVNMLMETSRTKDFDSDTSLFRMKYLRVECDLIVQEDLYINNKTDVIICFALKSKLL